MLKIPGAALIIIMMVAANAALADEFNVKTESGGFSRGLMRMNFSVINNTSKLAKMVFVDCTVFDKNRVPVKTQVGLLNNVNPGQKAYGTVEVVQETDMKLAECRFSHASY